LRLITGEFNDSFQPIMDGVANVVKNYAYWLNKKYGSSYVITPSFPNHKDNEEFPVLRYYSIPLPTRHPYRYGFARLDRTFLKQIREIPFNIVHAHSPFSAGSIALDIARSRKIPIVATFHSKYYDDFKSAFKLDFLARYAVEKVVYFFHNVDDVWVVNKATKETLRSYGYKGPLRVVYNGTDFTFLESPEKESAMVNERLQLSSDEFVFLFVGQHIWHKNVRLIIESLHHLKMKGAKFKMIFVGSGHAARGMKRLVKKLGLEAYIYFMGVVLDRNLLKALFIRADLFLFPSVYDNAPIVVREAAACRCPSVLIEKTNAAEDIIDNYNGFLAPNDAVLYAECLFKLITDRGKIRQVGLAAQKTMSKGWEELVDDVYENYLEVINCYKMKNKA
jgi:1,2-diacylglycerol 3-alpha-glucosyltransferase